MNIFSKIETTKRFERLHVRFSCFLHCAFISKEHVGDVMLLIV